MGMLDDLPYTVSTFLLTKYSLHITEQANCPIHDAPLRRKKKKPDALSEAYGDYRQ
jgi:hypothetical protein